MVVLALRVRFNGSHATPRGLLWRRVLYGIALMGLLYQAVAATIWVLVALPDLTVSTVEFLTWSRLCGLLWVAAFGGLVAGRLVAARALVVIALASTVAVTIATHVIVTNLGAGRAPFTLANVSRWAWLAVSVGGVLAAVPHERTSRRLWFGAYLVGTLTAVPVLLVTYAPHIAPYGQWVRLGNLTNVASAALIIAMVVGLGRAVSGRPNSPTGCSRWPRSPVASGVYG